jgi:hypothetical protein
VSLGLALLLNLRQIAYLGAEQNRYMVHWEALDAWVVMAAVALTAGGILAGHTALDRARAPWLRRLRTPYLMLLLVTGGVSATSRAELPGEALTGAWIVGLGLLVVPSAFFWPFLHGFFLRAGLIAVPVAAVTVVQLLSWETWGSSREPLVAEAVERPAGEAATPVYVLVFDEWSYQQSTVGGEFKSYFENLRAIAERSFVFDNAISPAVDTRVSLPRLLFARNPTWTLVKEAGETRWERGEESTPTVESRSLFDPFVRAGYHTALVGFYLPYRRLLGDGVDVVRTRPHVPQGDGFAGKLGIRALDSARFLVGPGFRGFFQDLFKRRYSEHWRQLNDEIFEDTDVVVREWPASTFLFAHLPLPHAPFIFEADGRYRGPFEDRIEGTLDDYERHLRLVDRRLGEFVGALEEVGRFDASLLVITSDHGWKQRDVAAFHVPLLVKWPGQRKAVRVREGFATLSLPGLLSRFALDRIGVDEARDHIRARLLPVPLASPRVGRGR